jgi:hypothetical protein
MNTKAKEPNIDQLKVARRWCDENYAPLDSHPLALLLAAREAKLNFDLEQARALNIASLGAIDRLENQVSLLALSFGGMVDSIVKPFRKAINELCEALESRHDLGSEDVDELIDRVRRAHPKEKVDQGQEDHLRSLREKLKWLENERARIAHEASAQEVLLKSRISDLEAKGDLLRHEVDMVTDGIDAPRSSLPVAGQAPWKVKLREASANWLQICPVKTGSKD